MFLCAPLRAAAARSVRGRRDGGRLCATRGLGAALGLPGPSGGDSGKGIAPSRGRPRRLVAAGGLLWGRGALRCVGAGGEGLVSGAVFPCRGPATLAEILQACLKSRGWPASAWSLGLGSGKQSGVLKAMGSERVPCKQAAPHSWTP